MPKSRRNKVVHLTNVVKKNREQKEKLFENIREALGEYQHCFVFSIDNMRNTYLKTVRQELSDSRIFFGKTKLMARALGHNPEDSHADNIYKLTSYLKGTVGLLLTNREPESVLSYFDSLSQVDFARAGATSPRDFVIPYGTLYSTGGEVPAEHDVPLGHTLEPELRRLGVPTRMVKGRVVLEEGPEGGNEDGGYVVCREGDVLDSRQTRLLKLFSVCISEFKVKILAYWSAATAEVTELNKPEDMDGVEADGSD
ncbi:ribosomal protein L10-domain-containing protein [Microdochium trichocladiopsis]|uniref:Ribosome assembly factor mrt4 n=1 Tax=Microdochium trichocladiopsis TaxID=1682393 RepID=A0A9P9BX58_9PEZI|nr:ribosomal protein L10-domain-containing protein [Microdochium trichocladiopsis]KAH7041250.1 ribosomal protein L10-domain-containing protein [Microdochium trichocladiopsis]